MTKPVAIIGGGISGLVAGIELQKKAIPFLILEKNNYLGGRVASTYEQGFIFDHGFQVFQTAYPEARYYLNYEKLQLKAFRPGAIIFNNGTFNTISDPFRDFSKFFQTLFSPIATAKDKFLILKLKAEVQRLSVDALFAGHQTDTYSFLKNYGFSETIIEHFFQPFFAGIFLEQDLITSSDAFLFIYKMFTEGDAAIPAKGMRAITEQLMEQIPSESIRLETTVKKWGQYFVELESGERIETAATIVAIPLSASREQWNGTDCVYVEVPEAVSKHLYLVINSSKNRLINHIAFLSDVAPSYAQNGKRLASVTLSELSELPNADLFSLVVKELQLIFKTLGWRVIKRFQIPYSLPLRPQIQVKSVTQEDGTFLAGDHRYFGSVNFAMRSGREAAQAVSEFLA